MAKINLPLDIESLEITAQTLSNKGDIIIDVVSKNKRSTCHKCGKAATKRNGTAPERTIKHLSILDKPVYLRITPIRYSCDHCDDNTTTTEQYDWCDRNSTTTKGLEAYILRNMIHSTIEDVARKERMGYNIVQRILDSQVSKKVNWDKIADLETIGIDEISMKKGYQDFVTIISSKSKEDSLIIIAVLDGRSKKIVKEFLESIPQQLKKTVKNVCTDMYDGFVNATIEVFGAQCLVIDRYHISKLYREPLDKLRIKEMERLKKELSPEEYTKLDSIMWILRKNHECLSDEDKKKLALLYKHSSDLKKAHKYALNLTQIFNTKCNRRSAIAKINRWIRKIEKSDLTCFNKFLGTLDKYLPYIANYFKRRKSSGFVEGLNNKIKVAKRRCYGFIKSDSLFQRLFLDLQGFDVYA
jgi:transposase